MPSKKKVFVILIISVFAIVGLVFLFSIKKEIKQEDIGKDNLISSPEGGGQESSFLVPHKYCNFFPKRRRENYNPKLGEKSAIAILFDHQGSRKILYEKNIQKKLPIASLTKMMTAIVTIDNYDLNKVVTVTKKAVATPEETGRLTPGEKISVRGLLKLALLVSSNDAAAALSQIMGEAKFVKLMNEKADEIGLKNTHFRDPHGLDCRNVSSAEDLAILTQYAIIHYPEMLEILGKKQEIVKSSNHLGQNIDHWANNTNKLLSEDYVIGGKTGYTDEAGDTMILAMKAPGVVEGNVILVLLGLRVAERIPRTKNLYDWVMWGWNWGDF